MNIDELGSLLSKMRIVDLSKKIEPGKVDTPLGKRKYEIKSFIFPPGEIMHNIEMESHISTHLEAPSHWVPARYGRPAEDISEVCLDRFFGPAVLIDCKDMAPRTPLDAGNISRFPVRENDIVLVGNCSYRGKERCAMTREGMEYLVSKKMKMIGFDETVFVEDPKHFPRKMETYFTHDLTLPAGIPIIEVLDNLGALTRPRFLFMGFPAKMGGLESFPIRAVAFEDMDR
ncbi:MAG: cyclase family protein [Thermodesulfobacteriota bacterium]